MVNKQHLTKRLNFLLGKNGSGKSISLRRLEQKLENNPQWFIRYITPERGGVLTYNANVEQSVMSPGNWLAETRRRNRFEQFREQSVSRFRNLELSVLREIEQQLKFRQDTNYTFDS